MITGVIISDKSLKVFLWLDKNDFRCKRIVMRGLLFQSDLQTISDFKSPRELEKERLFNQRKATKDKADRVMLQKEKLYSLISKSLPKLRKYAYDTSVPVVVGRMRRFKITSRIERGWILDAISTGPGNGLYGEQSSTINYFVITENGVFGKAYRFGTGYRIPFGAFTIKPRNIPKLPVEYDDYHWGGGNFSCVACERISDNLDKELSLRDS